MSIAPDRRGWEEPPRDLCAGLGICGSRQGGVAARSRQYRAPASWAETGFHRRASGIRGRDESRGCSGEDLHRHRALSRPVVEVDQHELLPGPEDEAAVDERNGLGWPDDRRA